MKNHLDEEAEAWDDEQLLLVAGKLELIWIVLLLAAADAIAAGGVATAVAVVIVSCLMIPAGADDRSYGCGKRGGEVGVRRYGRRGGAHFVS